MPTFTADGPFDSWDKFINVSGPVRFAIDNDDVGPGKRLVAEHLLEILNEHWTPVYAWACVNEECEESYASMYTNDEVTTWLCCSECDTQPPPCPECERPMLYAEVEA